MKYRLVCFDMDGTLIRHTNSVRFLCELNGRGKELAVLEKRETEGEFSWIEADYQKAQLMEGLNVKRVNQEFDRYVPLIGEGEAVISHLKELGVASIMVTAGPREVAYEVGARMNFAAVYGSEYEVCHNQFTGRIIHHMGTEGKVKCLQGYCQKHGIGLDECIAVGDSLSDLGLFEATGWSVAINYSSALEGKASAYLKTESLWPIFQCFPLGCNWEKLE